MLNAARGTPARRTLPLAWVPWLVFALFAGWLPVALWLRHARPEANWPVGVLVVLAFFTTLVSTICFLPAQSVFAAVVFILVISGVVQAVGALTGIPFGPFSYTDDAGERIFGVVPWPLPLLWVVVILNGRGVARLILRPWRRLRTYGFRLIGLTCLFAALFDLGLEPFASRANGFWFWQPTQIRFTWFGSPWINLFGWAVTALLILAFATPWLINKKPVKRPPDYHPLLVWLGLHLFLLAGLASDQLWPAAGLVLAGCVVVATLALRNARG
jgi:putative membrane protein